MKVSNPSQLSPFLSYLQKHNHRQQQILSCGAFTLILLLFSLLGLPESYTPKGSIFHFSFALTVISSTSLLLLAARHLQFRNRFSRFRKDTQAYAHNLNSVASAVHYRFSGIESYLCNRPHRLSTKAVELFEMARSVSTVLYRRSEQVSHLAVSNKMSDVVRAHSLLSAPLRLDENAYSPLIFLHLDTDEESNDLDPILQDLFDRLLYEVSQKVAFHC
jgi:hypothetical protein